MNTNKFIGSTLLLIGTAIGAGMLALPMVSAAMGFRLTFILTVFVWALMTATALLVLEINLTFKPFQNSFSTMAYETLGKTGRVVAWIVCLVLLYALTAAYIAGNASLLSSLSLLVLGWKIPTWINAILFVLILGSVVFLSTKAVDYFNRCFISIKGVLLVGALFLLIPHINFVTLIHSGVGSKYIWAAAPIFLCSFGFHTVIPSLTNYLGPNPKILRSVILTGTIITLVIYLLWLTVTLGIVPIEGSDSFNVLIKQHGSVGEFVELLAKLVNNKNVTFAINGFANIAMTTSFFGVSLGLFDFLADAFKSKNSCGGRLKTAVLTFSLPLLFAIFYPQGFIIALGYAAICVAILEIILPVLMVMKLRKNQQLELPYRSRINNFLLFVILGIGVILVAVQILSSLQLLPVLK